MVVLLQRRDRLVVLLERQEVNPEAVRHRLLLRVVLELAGFMKEHLTQRQTLSSCIQKFGKYLSCNMDRGCSHITSEIAFGLPPLPLRQLSSAFARRI